MKGKGETMRAAAVIKTLPILLLGAAPVSGEAVSGGDVALLRMAERFEERAYGVLDEALREHRYLPRDREVGLDAIQELAWVAGYFRDRVRYEPDPYRTASDFEILAEAYARASWWINRVPRDRRLYTEFRRLGVAFDQLEHRYRAYWAGYGGTARHRMDDVRYREILRTRVIPRVHGSVAYRRGEPRLRLDIGLRIPGGRVRVVWR
jgi:hypothetical protein